MTAKIATKKKTEAELEARANHALQQAIAWLDRKNIRHQLTFSFKLGHEAVPINGRTSSSRLGRVDMLIEREDERIAIVELKRPGDPLTQDDVEQGLSYARVLHPRPPLVIVSNGRDTRTYATHDGRLLGKGERDEKAFADLTAAALKIAESDVRDAIATLMGPKSDVWMAAVRAASRATLEELSGGWDDPQATFTNGIHFSRKASSAALAALRGPRRVVAVEGVPLVGKSHVLAELTVGTRQADDIAILFVEASGSAATGIADEVAHLLGSALGWRITADEARHWMLSLGRGEGAQLIIAVDGLGLEHDAIRREIEALTAKAIGSRLKFVIEADTAVVDRLWQGETRRKDTVFARRGTRILVDALDDEEFARARTELRKCGVDFMHGANRAEEYRQPWLLKSLLASVVNAPDRPKNSGALLPPLLSLNLFQHVRERFVQDPLVEQAAAFARAVLEDYQRPDRTPEVRLRAMHTFLVRKETLRKHADQEGIADMWRSGLIGSTLDASNCALMVGRIPGLLGSELARLLARELVDRLGDDDRDVEAANWLVDVIAVLPMGDLIGAQALIDCAPDVPGLPLALINRLLGRRPSVRPVKPGTRALVWVPEIGQLEMKVGANGAAIMKLPGTTRGFELPMDAMNVTYGNLDAWMLLSHLAAVRLGAFSLDEEQVVGLIDPAILALVGTSPVPLRRASADLESSGMHLHDAPDGSSLVCRQDGIIEPVTFSIFRFLERERDNADEWLVEACEEGSAALLNRVSLALAQLASLSGKDAPAKWARERDSKLVGPALQRALHPADVEADQ
jgi:hypothetical protein